MKKLVVIPVILFLFSISAYAQMGGQMRQGMMGQTPADCQSRIKCAEQWLKKAIDLHEITWRTLKQQLKLRRWK